MVEENKQSSIDKYYSEESSVYDENRYGGKGAGYREKIMKNILISLIKPSSGMKILDIGTGTGRGVMHLTGTGAEIIGVDANESMLEVARKKVKENNLKNIEFRQVDALKLPFPSDTFDAVISLNFIHLFYPVKNQKAFVEEMKRVLKPNGLLLIEIANALHGPIIGLVRKYFKEIGYNYPHQIKKLIGPNVHIERVVGGGIPWIWRLLGSNSLSNVGLKLSKITYYWPFKYISFALFILARKKQ